jgi:hydroxymethylbilane synthase
VGIHAKDGTIRGFVGLPDGSAWVADELRATDGTELANRLLSAGAGELLARAEAMA